MKKVRSAHRPPERGETGRVDESRENSLPPEPQVFIRQRNMPGTNRAPRTQRTRARRCCRSVLARMPWKEAAEPTECVICLDAATSEGTVACAANHVICNACFDTFVASEAAAAAHVDVASLADSERRTFGHVFCPCRGLGGCEATAYDDATVAVAVSKETFGKYLTMRSLVAVSEQVTQAYTEAHATLQDELGKIRATATAVGAATTVSAGNELLAKQLKRTLPNARQCRQCKWGPMDFRARSE